MPTVARILELAPTCSRLAEDHRFKRALFSGTPKSSIHQGILIYCYWKILNKIYELDNNYAGLEQPANHLWELCQKWQLKAASIVDGGSSGQVTPVTPVTLPTPYYFLVDGSSFIADGASSKTFPASWQGFNIVFARNGITQTTVTSEPTYFTWNSTTAEFTCSPAVVSGELLAFIPT